ncbi:MAG: hypothetical protein MJA83_19565, partial [Gammaproteobacteria bacterium]|nr:hypothetical protein [Gammaproteobacteria bacterium]
MKSRTYRLRIKVISGLLVFVVLIALQSAYVSIGLDSYRNDREVLGHVSQLELSVQQLTRKSLNYLDHAPRDYPTYYRDVAVFNNDLQNNIDTIDALVEELDADYRARARGVILELWRERGSTPQLGEAISELSRTWEDYRAGLFEKLGDNAEEPRLEWGAEFIAANQAALTGSVERVSSNFRNIIETDFQTMDQLTTLAVCLSLAFAALALVWFYFHIIKRMQRTMRACSKIARGEFGG